MMNENCTPKELGELLRELQGSDGRQESETTLFAVDLSRIFI